MLNNIIWFISIRKVFIGFYYRHITPQLKVIKIINVSLRKKHYCLLMSYFYTSKFIFTSFATKVNWYFVNFCIIFATLSKNLWYVFRYFWSHYNFLIILRTCCDDVRDSTHTNYQGNANQIKQSKSEKQKFWKNGLKYAIIPNTYKAGFFFSFCNFLSTKVLHNKSRKRTRRFSLYKSVIF